MGSALPSGQGEAAAATVVVAAASLTGLTRNRIPAINHPGRRGCVSRLETPLSTPKGLTLLEDSVARRAEVFDVALCNAQYPARGDVEEEPQCI